jgi:hypothetical protein
MRESLFARSVQSYQERCSYFPEDSATAGVIVPPKAAGCYKYSYVYFGLQYTEQQTSTPCQPGGWLARAMFR